MLCLPVNFIVLREQAEEVNKSSNEWINEWMIEGKKYFKQNTVLREGGWRNRRIGISFTIALSLTGGRNLSLSKLGFMTWWDYISLHQHQPGASFAFIRHGTPREYFPWKWNVALPPSLPSSSVKQQLINYTQPTLNATCLSILELVLWFETLGSLIFLHFQFRLPCRVKLFRSSLRFYASIYSRSQAKNL